MKRKSIILEVRHSRLKIHVSESYNGQIRVTIDDLSEVNYSQIKFLFKWNKYICRELPT